MKLRDWKDIPTGNIDRELLHQQCNELRDHLAKKRTSADAMFLSFLAFVAAFVADAKAMPASSSAFLNKGTAVWAVGDHRAAVGLYDRAIEIWERLVHQDGRREAGGNLAFVKANRAGTLIDLGEVATGVKEGRMAGSPPEQPLQRAARSTQARTYDIFGFTQGERDVQRLRQW